jgi:signal transduction histidine kinase
MTEQKLPTAFAPAERSAPHIVEKQMEYFLSDEMLLQIFNAVPDVVLVLNKDRQIVFSNRALLEATGLSEQKVRGMRPGEVLGCVHAFETEGQCGTTEFCQTCGAVRAILSSLNGKESVQECRITLQSQQSLDLRVWATPLQVGEEPFSVFAVKDISHEKRRRVLERVFFHDILNVAGGLRGFADLLQDAPPDELEYIQQAISDLSSQLVQEINTQQRLTAAEHGELKVYPDQINPRQFLADLLALYRKQEIARERGLQLVANTPDIWFTSDPNLLRQVIGHMIRNGLEGSAPNEVVTVGAAVAGERIEFTVHSPTFIPRNIQLQIFQRSFSTKGAGRGLGTYTIKLLSEQYLQGHVSFFTSPEEGTTFKGSYPLSFTLLVT